MNRAVLALLACTTAATACSGDDVDPGRRGGSGVLIHTSSFTPDGASTHLYVVDELTADLVLDPATAIELMGRADVSVPPLAMGMRSFFVGLGEEPTIRRYDIADDGKITVGGQLSLQGLGAKSAASLISGLSFTAKDRAYFVDVGTLQVIVIDPEKMEIVRSFPLTEIAEPGMKATYAWYKNIDGSRIVVAFAFDRSDDSPSPLSKVAIIDTTNDTVVYDKQSRCGYLSWTARDAAGNIYLASHTWAAIMYEAGLGGDPKFHPCMVRIRSGANGFDPDYYVDLYELAGRPVGALMAGADGTAYTLVYRSAAPLTAQNVDSAYRAAGWEHHSLKLGGEAPALADVPGVGPGLPYSAPAP